MLHELENAMEEVQAKSSYCGYVYQLSDILIIMVCGLLANLQDINRVHAWSLSRHVAEFLKTEFGITQIPCCSHFYNILACVNYEAFAQCFSEWMANMLSGKTDNKIIAIDGKTIRSTLKFSYNYSTLHIASAIISDYRLIIGSKECKGKLGEVDAFLELIETLDITGTLIVADALHCKKNLPKKLLNMVGIIYLSSKRITPICVKMLNYVAIIRKMMSIAQKKKMEVELKKEQHMLLII